MSVRQAPGPTGPDTRPGSWRDRLAALRSSDLRLIWLAQVVSQLGDGVFTLGIVVLTVELTASGLALSGTLMAQLLPYALLGAPAGALADRWNRRLTMVGSDIARGLVVALLPLLHVAGWLHAWMIPIVAFLLTTGGLFFDPAKNALVPTVTPAGALVRVNALLAGTRQVLFIAAPALGGVLAAAFGTMTLFWIDAASFFLSAAILARMRVSGRVPALTPGPPSPRPSGTPLPQGGRGAGGEGSPDRGHLLRDIQEGLRYVWRVPVLRLMVIVGTFINFILSPLPVILPLLFLTVLGLGTAAFGTALSFIFAGFLLGVAFVGVSGSRIHLGYLTTAAMAVAGLAVLALGAGPPLTVIHLIGLVGGAAVGIMEVAETTVLQRESTDEVRGRVFALYESVSQGGRAVSVALAGALSEVVGLRAMFYTVGALTLACAVLLALSPPVRRLARG
jgi:MFS family permease